MCKALQPLLGNLYLVFLDDILVFSKNINPLLPNVPQRERLVKIFILI